MNKRLFVALGLGVLATGSLAGQSLEGPLRKEGSQVRASYDTLSELFQTGSVVLYEKTPAGYGVVVGEDGLVLVKTSEFENLEDPSIVIGKKRYRDYEIVASSSDWDVSLLKIEVESLEPVKFSEVEPDHGSIVLSNSSSSRFRRRAQLGVIAANPRAVGEQNPAVLGIVMQGGGDDEEPLTIVAISPNSGAKDAGLENGDRILAVTGKDVFTKEEIPELLKGIGSGEKVAFVVDRPLKVEPPEEILDVEDPFEFAENHPAPTVECEQMEFEVELRHRHEVFPEQLTRNDSMTGEFSKRRTNFPRIIQHDTSLMPRSTGGPLITLDGLCVGMNIAFVSRECSYAIPAKELQELVAELKVQAGL